MANWLKQYKTHIISIILSLSVAWTGATLIKPEDCKCQDCSSYCLESCGVCEVKIVDGIRIVCRKNICEFYPIEKKGETNRLDEILDLKD